MPDKKKNNILLVIILAVVFGISGGVVGELLARAYIWGGIYDIPFFGGVDLSNGSLRGSNLIIQGAKKVVVEQNDKADEVIKSARRSLVGIFKKKAVSPSVSAAGFNLSNYYLPGEEVGEGLIITSDGWIVSGFKIDNPADYVVITEDKKIYAIDKVAGDKLTSFNFLRIAAKDLPVKRFVAAGEVRTGESVLAINWDGSTFLTTVSDARKRIAPAIAASDSFVYTLALAEGTDGRFNGAVLFNLAGDVVGLFDKDGVLKPITHFNSAIESLLKDGAIKRPSLGVNYVDLSRLIDLSVASGLGEAVSGNSAKGALIARDASGKAFVKGSAAQLTGLREGDVILSINDIKINGDNDLSEVLQGFQSGEKVTIAYLRGEENGEAEVELREIAN